MPRKNYDGPVVDVSFDREVCQRAAECVRGMPEVFDTSKRPWINPTHANTADLANHLGRWLRAAPPAHLNIVEHQE